MCKINWEERFFEVAKDLYVRDKDIELAFIEAGKFVSHYKEAYALATEEIAKEEKPKVSKDEGDDDFVEMIYSLYPTKCPKRGSSLGKSAKDKNRIRKLLKTYTKEQIEAVVRKEIGDKYGISYMQNFSTFLNNFPDPSIMVGHIKVDAKKEDTKLVIGGVVYK
jgi:hypothetical protein